MPREKKTQKGAAERPSGATPTAKKRESGEQFVGAVTYVVSVYMHRYMDKSGRV